MTPQEFKAWFDGFTEGLQGLPNEDQWARIKARVAQIDNAPVSKTIFINDYWPPYRRYWSSEPYWGVTPGPTYCSSTGTAADDDFKTYLQNDEGAGGFDSLKAMQSLGAAEFRSI